MEFDPMNIETKNAWQSWKNNFETRTISAELHTKKFIDDSFKNLRQTRGAFLFLLDFNQSPSRPAIASLMRRKFADVLLQYCRDVRVFFSFLIIFSMLFNTSPYHTTLHPTTPNHIILHSTTLYLTKLPFPPPYHTIAGPNRADLQSRSRKPTS